MNEPIQTIWGTIDAPSAMTLADLVARLKAARPTDGHYILHMTLHVSDRDHEPEFDIWDCRTEERWKGRTIAGAWAAFDANHQPNPLATLSRELEACNATGAAYAESR